jgi:hypothetical protein
MHTNLQKTIATAFAAAVLSGCAAMENQDTMAIERRLSAAGFQMKLADTPEKIEHLNQFAQQRLVPMDMNGETVFVYADGKSCKCVFVGSQANYQEYERLSIQQNVADEQRMTAANYDMAVTNESFNWDMWGAWPRPIIY